LGGPVDLGSEMRLWKAFGDVAFVLLVAVVLVGQAARLGGPCVACCRFGGPSVSGSRSLGRARGADPGSLAAAFRVGSIALFAPCCITVLFPIYLAAAVKNARWQLVPLTLVYAARWPRS
jgi:hypothetical protein